MNFAGHNVDQQVIRRMSEALRHRGPDDSGVYCQEAIGLGHRRLSIIDLSASGRQPLWSNDRSLCIVFNGEVYNYQEIKQKLLSLGYHFDSTTDTEVVVNAIHYWGIDKALEQFIGMFAMAIWDSKKELLYLIRDRAGIKPLYYYVNNDFLIFGSELKSLLVHPLFPKQVDYVSLGQYFILGYSLLPRTIFANTFKVPPGHYLVMDNQGQARLHKYWGLDNIRRNSFTGDFPEAAQALEEVLDSAFRYRLVSDVPVGLFLSGGIDSSLLSSILTKNIQADILNITIGFREGPYDEAPKASRVAAELGVRHIVHYITPDESQRTLLKFCDIYDEPFGDTSGIPTYILSRLARQHVKVALSADGGDEQFCGYEAYADYARRYRNLTKVPWLLRFMVSLLLKKAVPYRLLSSYQLTKERKLLSSPQFIARYEKLCELLKIRNVVDLLVLMNEKAWNRDNISEFLPVDNNAIFNNTVLSPDIIHNNGEEIMDSMMYCDYQAFLTDDVLVKVDRASMHNSLECRDPFLDHRIAELAFSLPVKFLYNQGEHKRILKHLLRKYLSEAIVSAPKQGFSIPLYYWLKGIWQPVVREYLSPQRVKAVGILDAKKVEREMHNFYKYNGCRAEKIWMMLNFQMWAERWYMARPGHTAAIFPGPEVSAAGVESSRPAETVTSRPRP